MTDKYTWTDNPTESGVSKCDTDVLNDCLMHLKYSQEKGDGIPLFTPLMFDKVLSGDELVGWALQGSLITRTYPDAVDRIINEYKEGSEEEYRGIQVKRALNGHIIADIGQKDAVDTLYFDTGVADVYILDSVSKQFYLPRNRYFAQFTGDVNKVNGFVEAGVPNITGGFGGNIGAAFPSSYGDIYTNVNGPRIGGPQSVDYDSAYQVLDPSRNNPIWGKSSTVQPPASLKLLYYKVGNTVAHQELIDVGNVLTDIQLKADVDFSNVADPAQSFKEMSVDWGVPDYARGYYVSNARQWVQVQYTSFVNTAGSDPYSENYNVYVSPNKGVNVYRVGYRFDDVNGNTQGVSFNFVVPKGWFFINNSEYTSNAWIYPLKGVN